VLGALIAGTFGRDFPAMVVLLAQISRGINDDHPTGMQDFVIEPL
jgi:hypothetical protein